MYGVKYQGANDIINKRNYHVLYRRGSMKNCLLLFVFVLFFSTNAFASASRYLDGQYITNGAFTLTIPTVTATLVPDTRTVNGHALSSNVTVSASDVSLGNVTNDAQIKVSDYAAKSDLLVGTGAGTFSALATAGAGDNGKVLTANSAAGTGMAWTAIPAASPTMHGTSASPQAVIAATGVVLTSPTYHNYAFVVGSPGAVIVSATPSITAGSAEGQELKVIGTDDTKTVKLQDQANLASSGLSLNGDWIGKKDSVLILHWDVTQSLWVEDTRR